MLIPGLQDSELYYFGFRNRGQVYRWGPDLDIIEGLLIESDEARRECLAFLESRGAVVASVPELLQYAKSQNWPHLRELELSAGSIFPENNG